MAVKKTESNDTQNVEEVVEKTETKATKPKTAAKKTRAKSTTSKPKRPKVDLSTEVPVVNMSQASFIYVARKGNGFLELEEYLDTDYMTIEDLQIMKNSRRGIFEKGWLLVDDEDAVKYLGIQKYMDNILRPEQLEEIFELPATELKERLGKLSNSMKETVYQTMKTMYEQNKLSNAYVIKAIEDSLNVDANLSVLNN